MTLRNTKRLVRAIWYPVIILCGLVTLLVVGAQSYVMFVLKPKMESRLAETVHRYLGDHYNFKYDNFNLNLLNRSASFTNIRLTPDSTRFAELKRDGFPDDKLYEAFIPRISITGLDITKAIMEYVIEIKRIRINKPEISVIDLPADYKITPRPANAESSSAPGFDSVLIHSIILSKGIFNRYTLGDTTLTMGSSNITVDLMRVRISTQAANDSTRLFFSDDVRIKLQDLHFKSSDGFYSFKVDNLEGLASDSIFTMDSINLIPAYGKLEFGRNRGYSDSRMEIRCGGITFRKVDIPALVQHQELVTESATINGLGIFVFNDKGLPDKAEIKKMPQDYLRNIQRRLKIDTLILKDGFAQYEELGAITGQIGKVFFSGINAQIYNITNDTNWIALHPYTEVDLSMSVLGKSNLQGHVRFALADEDNSFSYNGHLNNLNLTAFNQMVTPLENVSIKSGLLQRLDFNVSANEAVAVGEVNFRYNDLKIQILNSDEEDNSKGYNRLKSWLANMLVIKSSNPDGEDDPLRPGEISYRRDPRTFIFNFFWKAILDGVRRSVGISEPMDDQQDRSIFKKIKDKFKDGDEEIVNDRDSKEEPEKEKKKRQKEDKESDP